MGELIIDFALKSEAVSRTSDTQEQNTCLETDNRVENASYCFGRSNKCEARFKTGPKDSANLESILNLPYFSLAISSRLDSFHKTSNSKNSCEKPNTLGCIIARHGIPDSSLWDSKDTSAL